MTTPVNIQAEEAQYLKEVEEVKQWWSQPRWKATKRPFTAEAIVQKRGNLKIEYPSNVQSKKVWDILEKKFAVCLSTFEVVGFWELGLTHSTFRTRRLPSPTDVWIQSWFRRWPSTSRLSTFPDGSALRPLPPHTSHPQILQIILW
jgi:isocitrate lyase